MKHLTHLALLSALVFGQTPQQVSPITIKTPDTLSVGSPIASATTIAPITPVVHITGTAPIQTITAPFTSGCETFIADGAWSMNTSGNIAVAVSATANSQYTLCYDGTKWYPPPVTSGGAGGGFTCAATNASANALQCGSISGFSAPQTLAVTTTALANSTTSTTVTITVNGVAYTIFSNTGNAPRVGQIAPSGETLFLQMVGTSAYILLDSIAYDTTMTCSWTYPWTCGVNWASLYSLANTFTGKNVFSAELGIPNSGTLPATCSTGDVYQDTAASVGSQFYVCTSTNTWTLQGGSSTSAHYTWAPAAVGYQNGNAGPSNGWSVTGTMGATGTFGGAANLGLASILFPATASTTFDAFLPYVLADTSTASIQYRVLSTLNPNVSGTGTYILYVSTACATMGTTSYASLSYTLQSTLTLTISSSTNDPIGIYSTVSSFATGCSTGQMLVTRVRRTPGVGSDTAADIAELAGIQIKEIY